MIKNFEVRLELGKLPSGLVDDGDCALVWECISEDNEVD